MCGQVHGVKPVFRRRVFQQLSDNRPLKRAVVGDAGDIGVAQALQEILRPGLPLCEVHQLDRLVVPRIGQQQDIEGRVLDVFEAAALADVHRAAGLKVQEEESFHFSHAKFLPPLILLIVDLSTP